MPNGAKHYDRTGNGKAERNLEQKEGINNKGKLLECSLMNNLENSGQFQRVNMQFVFEEKILCAGIKIFFGA